MKYLICGALLLLLIAPAGAVNQGTDDFTHTNVGAIMVPLPSGEYIAFCSGTLVHAEVFLSAGHCTDFMEFLLFVGAFTIDDVYITFEQAPTGVVKGVDPIPASWKAVKSVHTHPGYFEPTNGGEVRNVHDMGLLVLKAPAAGVTPAALPSREVFAKRNNGALSKKTYTLVGYGSHIETSPPAFLPGGTRQKGFPRYYNVVGNYIWMQQNPNAGRSGGCFGDSGGPIFATVGGTETIVAIVRGGDRHCLTQMICYRMDTDAALDFLDDVIDDLD
ncbi:MAG: trypsin-like serine protease [Planctomycetota bacterium]|jgi:hypothetical protein